MYFEKFKIIALSSITASMLLLSGCGSSSSSSSSSSSDSSSSNSSSSSSSSSSSTAADTTAPVFTSSAAVNVVENGTLNHTVVATDANTVTYSIEGSAPGFAINATTGLLTFTAPAVDSDTASQVNVKAQDTAGNMQTQLITVTVTEAGDITNRVIMPLDTVGSFEKSDGNLTVTNIRTGFVWEDTNSNENNSTFVQAQAHCESLKTSNFAGKNNWRLPTRADLFKLANYNNANPNVYSDDTFSNRVGGAYWTSEEINATTAWTVSYAGVGDFKVSKTLVAGAPITSAYVRCVSGDHQPARFDGNYTAITRIDLDTDLEWHTHRHDNLVAPISNGEYPEGNFTTAQATCATYGYRLPTINELRSIVDYESTAIFGDLTVVIGGTTFDSGAEENGFDAIVWTSTENIEGSIRAMYISPNEILDTAVDKNLTFGPGTPDPIRTICVQPRL
ncbi:MAG: DUF1566 domain-containing protein [Epsilonproteobacteria bacterium]|nr:DUF1566 domain-containing protein [Campylobacterota bacterium]